MERKGGDEGPLHSIRLVQGRGGRGGGLGAFPPPSPSPPNPPMEAYGPRIHGTIKDAANSPFNKTRRDGSSGFSLRVSNELEDKGNDDGDKLLLEATS
mmetsp:Transcript_3478/g.5908  ORF Transcript_3478/g.5908 Transcript_3478/m.5908 type:complete len:98 (-) Transcript_3478:367-660(-)